MLVGVTGDEASTPGGRTRPPLVRCTEGRLAAGGAGGIARHLGLNVALVRVLFALLTINGVGVLVYLAVWLLVPDDADDGSGRSRLRRPGQVIRTVLRTRPGDDPPRRQKLLAYVLVGSAVGSIFGVFGLNAGSASGLPLTVPLIRAPLLWWRAPAPPRAQWGR